MGGAIGIAIRKKVAPILHKKTLFSVLAIMIGFAIVGYVITSHITITYGLFFIIAAVLNGIVVLLSWNLLKKMARALTIEDTPEQELH